MVVEEATAVEETGAVTGTDGAEVVETRRLFKEGGVVWGVAGGRGIALQSATARRISRRTTRNR